MVVKNYKVMGLRRPALSGGALHRGERAKGIESTPFRRGTIATARLGIRVRRMMEHGAVAGRRHAALVASTT